MERKALLSQFEFLKASHQFALKSKDPQYEVSRKTLKYTDTIGYSTDHHNHNTIENNDAFVLGSSQAWSVLRREKLNNAFLGIKNVARTESGKIICERHTSYGSETISLPRRVCQFKSGQISSEWRRE